MPHPQESDPRFADQNLPVTQARAERAPWWVIGQNVVASAVLLFAQLALLWVFVSRIAAGEGQWFNWVVSAASAAVVVASVASIAYWARR